jgi:hypothetical protein
MTSLTLEPMYGSILATLAAAIAIVLVVAAFTPQTTNPAHRRLLIGLRSAAAIALLLVAFGPALIRTDNRPADATLVVAVDLSRSMTLPDSETADRWTTQLQVWQQLSQSLATLDESLQVQLIGYDRDPRVIADVGPNALQDMKPTGDLTDLAAATAFSLQTAGGSPLAGVVFIGDGRQTAPRGNSKAGLPANLQSLGAQRSVETLNSLGVPFWTIPIGPAGGATATRDVGIDGLDENFQLFAGNEFDVSFQLQARGLAGVEVPVQLTWIDAAGNRTEAANRTMIPEKSDESAGFVLPLTAPAPGAYRLEVAAAKQSGELVTQNNRQIAFAEVREGGGRILYLEGTARPEQTFVRRALRRFPDLDLRYKWLRKDRSWPIDLDNWLQPGKFDIYIIGDLDAAALGDAQLEQLAETIAQGAGLVTLGGYQAYGAGGYADSPLAAALPIRLDSSRRRDARALKPADDRDHIPGPLAVQLRRAHPITDLGGDDPAATWRDLPPLTGANRFVGPKVAPGVQVLLQSADQEPLLVVGEYGRGRVASLAFDSTWRWWRDGNSEAHRRFWRQLMLWLLSREETGGDRIVLELDSRRFALENPPEFRAGIETISEPSTDQQLIAEVVDAEDQVTPIAVTSESPTAGRAAAIGGKLPRLEPGLYRLRIRVRDNASIEPAELAFQAVDESRELAQPMADPVYLRQLAEITANHGGAAFSPDEVDALVETIAQRRRQAETPVVEKHRLGDGPISGWILFSLFAGCLSAEWFLRRRWGLA